jgi:Domain of unknown function (DUF4157)
MHTPVKSTRTPSFAPVHAGLLQRKCACGGTPGPTGECEACRKKRLSLQRRTLNSEHETQSPAEVPAIVHDVLRSPGQPLNADTRAFMEPRFGHDFSQVRVHTSSQAAESSRALNALAYTVGQDVVFGAGYYAPTTGDGKRLLAHELTHTIQQSSKRHAFQRLQIDPAGSQQEREADHIAFEVASGTGARTLSLSQSSQGILHRACGPAGIGTPTACTGVMGDVVGERFHFVVNCDDLQAVDQPRLELFAATIASGELIEIHGFASLDGDPTFNENLSCARAIKAQSIIQGILTARGISASTSLFHHGATPGADAGEQRSVVVTRSGIAPPVPPSPALGCVAPLNPDRAGRAFNPTTSSQAAVIASHPIDAFTVNGLADDALALAQGSGLSGLHLGPADSLRHCFWNCRMAQELGAAEAEEFATGHENSGPSPIPFDNQMDLHDNSIGRGLGTPGADCEADCRSAVTAGVLRTLRGPEADASALAEGLASSSPPVPTTCIGASNQPWP